MVALVVVFECLGDATRGHGGLDGLIRVAAELVGNTQRRNAQNRNAICSRLPMMYAEMKSAMFSIVSDTSGTRRPST